MSWYCFHMDLRLSEILSEIWPRRLSISCRLRLAESGSVLLRMSIGSGDEEKRSRGLGLEGGWVGEVEV